jgi:small subunit ribosomal protein S7
MRKAAAKKRDVRPDLKFKDPLVTEFINKMMLQGRKTTAINVFYDSIDLVEKYSKENGYEMWKKALNNIMPSVEVKSRRIGGANFQIPTEIRPAKKIAVGMRWLIQYSRERNGKSMAEKLANEIIAASKGEGAAVKKKEDTHRMAEANKAFSHFKA